MKRGVKLLQALVLFVFVTIVSATHPPQFTVQPKKNQIIYELGNNLRLPFVADADPAATYSWEVNGKPFDPAGTDNVVVSLKGVGTLVFTKPGSSFSGFYKCRAKNSFGIAISNTIQIINSSLGSFPQWDNPPISKIAGEPLRIRCQRPESFPEATILWSKKTSSGPINVDYNDRVAIDPDGGLNFAYVKNSDSGDYRCHANNRFLSQGANSKPFKLTVSGTVGDAQSPPSKKNWRARTSETFIRGQEARIKCIYAGIPVPGVIWRRSDNKEISARAQRRSFGLELLFPAVEYADAGNYECDGYNTANPTPEKTTVIVKVQGHVEWVHKPQSVTKGENETVTFVCRGEAVPPPNPPTWYINGDRITGSSGSRIIGDGQGPSTTFTVMNLRKERDTMAIQCNITNFLAGSWVFASFYLNVQSEKPSIVQFREGTEKWAAGQHRMLPCKVFGAPTPIISWTRNQQPLTGGRFVKHANGTLEVRRVGITDAGIYQCTASNLHGSSSMSIDIVVRRPTLIRQAPEDLTVTGGTQAKFVCTALTDPDESQNLKITWLKDGARVILDANNRVYRNVQDNSLQIAGPISIDSGSYTCVASNGIDSARASATLRVQDRPDRPPVVSIEKCKASSAEIKWSPGTNNNAPLTNFIIQFQTMRDESVWYRAVNKIIPPKTTQYTVQLKPNNVYKFRVLAENKIGTSVGSDATVGICRISAGAPTRNPKGVRTLDEGSEKLVITWQPMSPVDFGGSDFRYVTKYRRADASSCGGKPYCEESLNAKEGTIGRPGELNIIEYKTTVDVDSQSVYTEFRIAVVSHNVIGASSATTEFISGYSGEGNPKQVVTGFRLKPDAAGDDMVYSDNATFIWSSVDESDLQSQGFFRGYMIQYKKQVDGAEDEHFDTRSIYIVIRDVKKEGKPMDDRKLAKNEYGAVENDDGTVVVTITHLPANSKLDFAIAVINKRQYGTLTSVLPVVTKEGAPGPVQQLSIKEHGPTHVRLIWRRPLEPNGKLTKYRIGFKSLNGLQLGPMQYPDSQYVWEPRASQPDISAKVTGLKPLQMYRFYVWAYTAAGQGSEYFIDDSTVSADYPDPPKISVDRLNNNTLNVSWVPATTGVPANVFYVQYKQESAIDQWQRTGWETNNNYIMVSNFVDGWRYEVRVIASNGGIYETGSESVKIFPTATSRVSAEATEVFTSSWFIGLLIVLILVSTFFALLCMMQQNTGGIYTGKFEVDETERLKPYDDSPFDEKMSSMPPEHREPETPASERYAPSHFSDRYPQSHHSEKYAPSHHSERYVGSQPPPQDEYMQDDPSKYGEEGSFIGQYRDKKELPNFKPRLGEPYKPPAQPPAQPQPRTRAPPSESAYSSGPVPEPRRSGYQPRGGYAPRQPPPRQPGNTAAESSNEYRPQYSSRAADMPDTRYRPAPPPAQETEHDTVV